MIINEALEAALYAVMGDSPTNEEIKKFLTILEEHGCEIRLLEQANDHHST